LFCITAKWYSLPLLHEILECGKEKLTTEEVINKLLLVTDVNGRTAWQVAMRDSYVEILQQLWEWAREEITTDEIIYCYLAQAIKEVLSGTWQQIGITYCNWRKYVIGLKRHEQ